MEQTTTTDEQQNPGQVYDTTFKDLFKQEVQDILPELLAGVIFRSVINIEMVRPVLRADEAYVVNYQNEDHIMHVEFEVSTKKKMAARLLAYSAILHLDHGLPVISIIVYPFRTAIAVPPMRIMSGERALVTFDYEVLPLFELDAETYVRKHATCMYPLLPAMQNATHQLLRQAMEELAAKYKDDEVALGRRYAWMKIFLERTDTVSPLEKEKIAEDLSMFEQLWEESAMVQKIRAEGEAKGGILIARQMLLEIVEERFPTLTEQVREPVGKITQLGELRRLVRQVAVAPDENAVLRLLRPPVA